MKTTLKANNAHFDELRIDSQDPKTSTPKPPNVKIGTECETPTRPHRIRSNRSRGRRQKKNRMSESEKKELNDSLKVFETSRSKSRSESQLEDASSKSRTTMTNRSVIVLFHIVGINPIVFLDK